MKLKIGTVYRITKDICDTIDIVDGLPNYYYYTKLNHTNFDRSFTFQRGIHRVASITDTNGNSRYPCIIISSSDHKSGTFDTPWQNLFDSDNGKIIYYGDNKEQGKRAEEATGNNILLRQYEFYNANSKEERMKCIPIIFFERVTVNGRTKGNLKFHGYGVIENVKLVTQYNSSGEPFSNYVFEFIVFDLQSEGEEFNWDWISDRCNNKISNKDTLRNAPLAWQKWIENGMVDLDKVRRKVLKHDIVKGLMQKPKNKSEEEKILKDIYAYYTESKKKHIFEMLAMRVTEEIFKENGAKFIPGWITCKSGDNGVDFVSRVDIGNGLAGLKIGILGQAKCEKINVATNANHVARTVARLRRGWFGVYVTTSYFSEQMQKEIQDDKFPIMLVNGLKVAQIVRKILIQSGKDLNDFLEEIDKEYIKYSKNKDPEEVLYI